MKKYFFLFILVFMTNALLHAQKKQQKYLEAQKDQSDKMIPYNGGNKYALIIIEVSNEFSLDFSTNFDGPKGSLIHKHEVVPKGAQTEHSLTFDATNKIFKDAQLIIKCLKPDNTINTDYNELYIKIGLSPDNAIKYYIDDPKYAGNKPCPVMHKLYGDEYFNTYAYERAREEYSQALSCWEEKYEDKADIASLRRQINHIDTITKLMQEAEQIEEKLAINENYKSLAAIYGRIYNLNPLDAEVFKKRVEMNNIYQNKCIEYKAKADALFNDDDKSDESINLSETYYQKLINLSCESSVEAKMRIKEMRQRIMRDNRRVFTYEYEKNALIGFSTGNYNNKTLDFSGYFTLRFNPNLFELIRLEDTDTMRIEANLSFGWTLKIFRLGSILRTRKGWDNSGLWLFFGPGATAICDIKDESTIIGAKPGGSENENEAPVYASRYNHHFAVSPEAGLLFKIAFPAGKDRSGWGLAFRYTYQYRHAFEKKDTDLFGKSRNVIGVGICF